MKIVFICDKLNVDRGGSNHSLDILAHRLSRRGHDVTVVTLNFAHENNFPSRPSYQVTKDSVGGGSAVRKAKAVLEKLTTYEEHADVLHIFNPAIIPMAGYHRRNRGSTPIVGRLNTYDVFCTNLSQMDGACHKNCTIASKFVHDDRPTEEKLSNVPRYAFDTYAFPYLANQVDALFALSPTVANIYEGIGIEDDLISVVPNCTDPSFKPPANPTDPFEDDDRYTVMYVGRLGRQKGVDLLIESLSYVADPSAYRVEIVGDGPIRDSLEYSVPDLPNAATVRFNGWVNHDDLPCYYKAADAFVHPGRWPEPFGRTIIEAMQCETPVLTSNIGAPPWIVDDPRTTFERENASALAATLDRLHNEQSEHFTADYPERLTAFDPDTVVSTVESRYQSIVTDI